LNELQVYVTLYAPDVICLTEVLPKHSLFEYCTDMYYLDGYKLILSELKGRGICIFSKPGIRIVTTDRIIDFKEYILCKLLIGSETVLLGVIYRSPNSIFSNNMHLCDLLNHMSDINTDNLLLVGDFNYGSINWDLKNVESSSISENMFLIKMQDLFLEQLILEPTRYRLGQTPHVLDLVITNNIYFVNEIVFQDPLGTSDHISLLVHLNLGRSKPECLKRKLFYKGDYNAMNMYLMNIDWTLLFSTLSTQQCLDVFYSHVYIAIDRYIPVSKRNICDKMDKEWVNFEVKAASRSKRLAWNKVRKDKTNDRALLDDWKQERNNSSTVSNLARVSFESKIILDSKCNPKSFWSYVKKRTKKPGDVSSLLDSDGKLVSDDKHKADLLNDYFKSVFVIEPDDDFFNMNCNDNVDTVIDSIVIEKEAILMAITKLNTSKSAGPDEIHAKIIKECSLPFCDVFYLLFKKSLNEGVLPYQWKQANVKALFKKGKRTVCSNYRPVSLTSIICKLFESFIRDRLLLHLEDNFILTKHQHGFRTGHSCATQLLEMMEDFSLFYDTVTSYDCIYLDFSKAFDRVPHNRLLTKLYNYGIRGDLFMWIKDFLANRIQRVCINNCFSDWSVVSSGIPQGSVLGPVLFTIFINDLPTDINSFMKIFADDTKMYNIINNSHVLQEDLNTLVCWSKKWLLPFNIDKCKVLHYGSHNNKHNYIMDGLLLSDDNCIKDLGVNFSNNLKFDEHVYKISATANSRLGIIKNTFHRIERDGFLVLYKSIVRPVLEYCNTIWSPYLRKHQVKIEQVQRRATRMIRGLDSLSYSERLRALNLTTLFYRRKRADIIQVYRIISNIDSIPFDDLFTFDRGPTRGNNMKLIKPRANTSMRLHSFSHRVINDWNDLPNSVVLADSLNGFKSSLERYWSEKVFKFEFNFY